MVDDLVSSSEYTNPMTGPFPSTVNEGIILPMADEESEAMRILHTYYNNNLLLRITFFVGAMLATFIVAWIVPWLLQKLFRDILHWELNFKSPLYKEMLAENYMKRLRQQRMAATTTTGGGGVKPSQLQTEPSHFGGVVISNKIKKYLHGFNGFMRTYFFTITYFLIRLFIIILGSFFSFLIMEKDFVSIIVSFGILSFIAFLQIGQYLSNIFAHFYVIFTSKVTLGHLVDFGDGQLPGFLLELGIVHATFLAINPHYNWNQELAVGRRDEHKRVISTLGDLSQPASLSSPGSINKSSYSGPIYGELPSPTGGGSSSGGGEVNGSTIYNQNMGTNTMNIFSNGQDPIQQYSLYNNMNNGGGLGGYRPVTPQSPYYPGQGQGRRLPHYTPHSPPPHEIIDLHLGYDQKFVERHVPNVNLVFGSINIIHL